MFVKEPEKFRKNIVNNLNTIIKNNNISQNLEKGIFNYSIQEAKKQKIIRKWNNSYFVRIYVSKLHNILLNLKKNSYVNNSTLLKKGANKQNVGDLAAKIREIRKPEPYKGKGIKYSDEYIKRKAGKTVGATAG